jgi:NhaP-type Na+/H+ or K+/H+ antiporter
VISADAVLLLLAGIAFLGYVLDALFDRIRISSILPLMLIGVLLVGLGVVQPGDVHELDLAIPYVSALTVAFILFSVGLEIRFAELTRVVGRATVYTLVAQTTTGVAISLLAFYAIHWDLLISFVFGFGLSGPSSIAVPRLLQVVRVPEALRTSMLYESVVSDVLQLLVPITLVGILVSGHATASEIAASLAWTTVGSVAVGLAAGLFWLFVLDRLKNYTKGYTWTLSITMVLATYGFADVVGMSAAITIFVFGVLLGNALLFDATRPASSPTPASGARAALRRLRRTLGLSTGGLDVAHIQQVQVEVAFFASSFFFVFIGLLFTTNGLSAVLIAVPLAAAAIMLFFRLLSGPILGP